MYNCAIDNKQFETPEGLQYLYVMLPDEDNPEAGMFWDFVVCSEGCADKVRKQALVIYEDRPWGPKKK